MSDFLLGVLSSIAAAGLIAISVKGIWPLMRNGLFYTGINISGDWDIIEERKGRKSTVGKITLRQAGHRITGNSVRTKTREGKKSDRQFEYKGTIHSDQVTLTFEDLKGKGFDTGCYIFIVLNDGKTMHGIATFHGKSENKIVSEERILEKVP